MAAGRADDRLEQIDLTQYAGEPPQNTPSFVYIVDKPLQMDAVPDTSTTVAIVRPIYPLLDLDSLYVSSAAMNQYRFHTSRHKEQIDVFNRKYGLKKYKKLESSEFSDDAAVKRDQLRRNELIDALKAVEKPPGYKQFKKRQKYNIRAFYQIPHNKAPVEVYGLYLKFVHTQENRSFTVYVEASSLKVFFVTNRPILAFSEMFQIINLLWGKRKALRR